MSAAVKILKYEMKHVVRGRAVLGYALFFAALTFGLLHFGGGLERTLPSLASVVLLAVPLVSLVVGTVFIYEGRDFVELVLSHPVGRRPLFAGLWGGVTLPLAAAFLAGTGAPLFFVFGVPAGMAAPVALVLGAGVLLTAVFTALAFVVAVVVPETAKGLGAALLLWLTLTVVYDGLVMLVASVYAAHPLERPMLALMLLNPVDLARVLVLMALDASALMGYTGAVFQRFFGSGFGMAASVASLVAWIALPLALAERRFRRMDM
ncbi:MAG TPA: ABC transporter permease subunit [Longimicrobiales bacterium]|nr:ABC transporter permease subunit [Longimicrobiales bacterium]